MTKQRAIRWLLIAVCTVGVIPLAAFGQSQGPGGQGQQAQGARRQRGQEPLWQKLNLTDEQKAKMQEFRQQMQQQMQAIRGDTSLTPEQKQAKIRELRQAHMKRMHSLLTPEQQKQLQELRRERRQQRQGNRPGPQG